MTKIKLKLGSILKNTDANTVLLLVGIAVGVLVLAVIFTVGPLVGYSVDNTVTFANTDVGNSWNSATNRAITNGTELWQQNTPMLSVAALIAIVGVIIAILLGVAKSD